MSTSSLSTCRAPGWIKIDRKARNTGGGFKGVETGWDAKKQKGEAEVDVRGGRVPRLNSGSGVLA